MSEEKEIRLQEETPGEGDVEVPEGEQPVETPAPAEPEVTPTDESSTTD